MVEEEEEEEEEKEKEKEEEEEVKEEEGVDGGEEGGEGVVEVAVVEEAEEGMKMIWLDKGEERREAEGANWPVASRWRAVEVVMVWISTK